MILGSNKNPATINWEVTLQASPCLFEFDLHGLQHFWFLLQEVASCIGQPEPQRTHVKLVDAPTKTSEEPTLDVAIAGLSGKLNRRQSTAICLSTLKACQIDQDYVPAIWNREQRPQQIR